MATKKKIHLEGWKSVLKQANTPVIDHGRLYQGFPTISSKLFRPEGRRWRVESNKDKKSQKKEGKGARKKFKSWLMRMHQSEILCIFTWNLCQNVATVWKRAFLAKFRGIQDLNTKNSV